MGALYPKKYRSLTLEKTGVDMRNEKGFTLIELIMVMVILGILSSVLIPRYFNFTEDAHKASVDAFVGNVKSSLYMYAADQILQNGVRAYPDGDDFENQGGLKMGILFDEIPADWTIVPSGNDKVIFEYDKTTPNTQIEYTSSGNNAYTLEIIAGPDYITNP